MEGIVKVGSEGESGAKGGKGRETERRKRARLTYVVCIEAMAQIRLVLSCDEKRTFTLEVLGG